MITILVISFLVFVLLGLLANAAAPSRSYKEPFVPK